MQYFFGVAIFTTSLFLIMLVLIQRGRGGGLAGALGGMGGQSAFGTKAGDLFTRITIGVAAVWIVLSVAAIAVLNRSHSVFEGGSVFSTGGNPVTTGGDSVTTPPAKTDDMPGSSTQNPPLETNLPSGKGEATPPAAPGAGGVTSPSASTPRTEGATNTQGATKKAVDTTAPAKAESAPAAPATPSTAPPAESDKK